LEAFCILLNEIGIRKLTVHGQDDSALIRRYLGGEQAAFEELYKRYQPRLAGFCFRLLLDSTAAEDVVQSVFVKALESIHTLRNPESFYSWLFTLARNEVYGTLRAKRSNGTVELSEEVWDEETPFDSAVRGETVEIVRECLDHLKVEYREVLILRQFEGLSYNQIAEITGNTTSSVESRLFKARKALIRQLKPYLETRNAS